MVPTRALGSVAGQESGCVASDQIEMPFSGPKVC